ncbi:TonB-dependent receptor domain-containing protein [Rhodanobacter lindaniclasticus]
MSSKRNSSRREAFPRARGARGLLALSVAISAALAMASVQAQDAQPTQGKSAEGVKTLDTVVVTGSHIRGTPEDAALPVEVVTAEDLRRQGSPTVLDFIKSLPITGSVLGESNQTNTNLGAQSRSGGGTINLRGLGPQRTLVLMNGRRFQYGQVDTNLLPQAAIGRVEILKDGAAATYGSDAIGGVVNFITRTDLQGFDISVDNRFVRGSDGDRTASFAYGWKGDNGNILVSAGFQHRSELSVMDRDWSYVPRTVNPTSYSAYSNPGLYYTSFFVPTVDVGCSALGGEVAAGACQFPFAPYLNLIERENRQQIYAEANASLSDSVRFHGETLYSVNDTPDLRTSPAFFPLNGPTGPLSPFTVPNTNPGAVTALEQAGYNAAGIAANPLLYLYGWRPFAMGGNPVDGGMGGTSTERKYTLFRTALSLDGDIGESTHWQVSGTYVRDKALARTPDILVNRLQRALNGLGGPNCTGTTPGANGCQYFDPFSNAVARNPALGLSNPYYVSANANSRELSGWLFGDVAIKAASDYWVLDAVVDGETGLQLGNGPVSYAVGGQVRRLSYASDPLNTESNFLVNPCPTPGDTTCLYQTGAFIFQGPTVPARLSEDVRAVFGELHLPIAAKLDAQLAVRYEDYGGQTGSTTNPKLALKWQATDWLGLRGSVGTTFRGPAPANVAPGGGTTVAFVGPAGGFRAVDNFGNPAVGPEKAFTYNVGALFKAGGFSASVDYWSYKLKDQIVSIPAGTIAAAVAGTGLANCSSPLRDLITFNNNNTCVQGTTTGVDIARIRSDTTNGPTVNTSGLDLAANYFLDDVWGGTMVFSTNATLVLKYDQEQFNYRGVKVSNAYDARGYLNYERLPGTVSKWRGTLAAEYDRGPHSLNARFNYIEGVIDDRGPVAVATNSGPVMSTAPVNIGSFKTVDLTYLLQLTPTWSFNASVFNLFDEDPPQTRTSLTYDPAISSPYGRSFKVGVRMQF